MKTYTDIIEFVVSLLLLVVLSFTLIATGYSLLGITLQLMIVTAVIGDVALFYLYRE